jgi:hypothetical protein
MVYPALLPLMRKPRHNVPFSSIFGVFNNFIFYYSNNIHVFDKTQALKFQYSPVETWWHTVTHGRRSERGNWPMEWVASTLHTTSEHGVSSITTADAHTSHSRLNWRPRRFKWTRPFRRKTKCGFCARAITFQTQSTQTSKIGVRDTLRPPPSPPLKNA